MYRAIVVDDEPWALIGIRNAFNWNQHGFEIIAEVTSSEEAFNLICSERPDVVFADIKMPKYTGIDLIRMTREMNINTEFVIISGFAEFTYAKEALKYGAIDYCIKPINLSGTDELLDKVAKHLEKRKYMRETLILEALIEKDEQELTNLEPFFISSEKNIWYAIIAYTKYGNIPVKKPKLLEKHKFLELKMGAKKVLYIVRSNQELEDDLDVDEFMLEQEFISMGISNHNHSLKNFAELIREADIAALQIFVTKKNDIYQYKENMNIIKPLLVKLQSALVQKEFEVIYEMIDNIKKEFELNCLGMVEAVYLWNQVIGCIIANNGGEESSVGLEFLNYSELKDRFEDFDSLCKFLCDVFKQLEQQNFTYMNENEILYYFEQLVKYIDKHYDDELYIKDLSTRFYLNQFYCCKLFKKIYSKTFSEYVLNIRIEKACQLLKNTDLTIEDISSKVGYKDYFYFNKVFKKQVGATPAKYRKI